MSDKEHTPQEAKENHPQVLRWNISDDHYNDGMTLYADGSLHINIGGQVWVRSLRGWFELSETNERLVRENKEAFYLLRQIFEQDVEYKKKREGFLGVHLYFRVQKALESPLDKRGEGEKC